MAIEWFLTKIDKALCSFLGLPHEEETRPIAVQMINHRLLVKNISSYKRHLIKETWDSFSIFSIKQSSHIDKEKLGLAAGKVIAKNLVVSFEESNIRENSHVKR